MNDESQLRARIEILEENLARLLGALPPGALGGDVTGPDANNVLTRIAALAGGGNRLVGVDNGGLVGVGTAPVQAMGGDVTGTTAASVVEKVHGSTVPAGPLTTGNVLQATGAAALGYAPVNLAGGVNFVTGVLPEANQADQTMAGDVTGATNASVVAKVNGATIPAAGALVTGNVPQVTGVSALSYGAINLAGGVNFVTGVLPEANQADQTMGGDVTGSTSASVISNIAALGGGGTVLVAVNNAGAVISGGAPPVGAGPMYQLLTTITDNLIPTSTAKTYDFDLSAATYTDSLIRLRCEFYGTTKDTGGVAGAHLTGVTFGASDAVYENTNGSVSIATAAAGGAANPMPNNAAEFPLIPCVCDAALRSGGGATVNAVWSLNGTNARLTLTTTNNTNRGSYELDFYQRKKTAP